MKRPRNREYSNPCLRGRKRSNFLGIQRELAERVGFEPTVRFPVHTLSKRAPSTTRTSLRVFRINNLRAIGHRLSHTPRPLVHQTANANGFSDLGSGHSASGGGYCVRPPNLLLNACSDSRYEIGRGRQSGRQAAPTARAGERATHCGALGDVPAR